MHFFSPCRCCCLLLLVYWICTITWCFEIVPRYRSSFCSRRMSSCSASSSRSKMHQKSQQRRRPVRATNRPRTLLILRHPDVSVQLDYARNGHAVLRQFLDPKIVHRLEVELRKYSREYELSAWQQKVEVFCNNEPQQKVGSSIHECQEQLQQILGRHRPLPFLQYFNTWRSIPSVFELSRQLAETASILMDVPSVRLYQDALFWKQSNGRRSDGATPWHVDARMAPFDTAHFLTFWIPLHHVRDSGLVFCSKTHADFALAYWHPYATDYSIERETSPWNALEDRYAANDMVDYMPLRVGDVTVHSGWTLHCADPVSQASRDRLALAISFVDAHAPIRSSSHRLCQSKDRNIKSTKSNYGDNEDTWSYKDWIHEVPTGSYEWDHKLVPILWQSPGKINKPKETLN